MRQLEKKTKISEQRRQDLIVATLRSLCKHGYLNSTINTISEESGLSRGLISHYFASKDDLLASAHRYYLKNADDFHRHLNASSTRGSFEKLYLAAAGTFLRDLGYSEIIIHYMSAAFMVPEIRDLHRELWGKYRRYIQRRLMVVSHETGIAVDARLEAIALAQLSDGLWLGKTMEGAYTAEECLIIIRNYLCGLFKQNPDDHPLWPDFELENFPTSAPLPKRVLMTAG